MTNNPNSWRALRDRRREKMFVGRADQLRTFEENLTADEPNYMVLAVTGEGGVGKSTLLNEFERIARESNVAVIVARCDDRQPSPVAVMGHVAEQLGKLGITHKEFDDRYKKYRELRQELESDQKVPRGVVKLLALGVSDFALRNLRNTPGVGVFFEDVDVKAAGDALTEIVNYGITRWGNKDEVQLLREPERELTPLFVALLGKACEKHHVVTMLDVFERTGGMLAAWLLALYNLEYGDLNTHATFVISGRDALEQHWTELADTICFMPLEPFTLEETRQYLRAREITDEALVRQIQKDTGGLGVLVELLAATKPQPGMPLRDIAADAVQRFLQWTPQEERRRAALVAAVPRQFNRDILTAALGEDATGLFNWLDRQSYNRTSKERGCFYHERVRELMLRYLRTTTPDDLKETHKRLAEYFATKQAGMNLEGKEAYKSEEWRALERERVYHTVGAHPDRDMIAGINAFLHAMRWKWRFAEEIAEACKQAGEETGSQAAKSDAEGLASIYSAYDKNSYEAGVADFYALEGRTDLTTTAQCAVEALLAKMEEGRGKDADALMHYGRAIAIDPTYAWALKSRGEKYRRLRQYEGALMDLSAALALDENDVDALLTRGLTYSQMGKHEEALADFNRALELDDKNALALAHRGLTYSQMGKHEEALADFNRALELDDKDAWALAVRGVTYRQTGQYEQALTDLNAALALNDKDAWALAMRGETYRLMGKAQAGVSEPESSTDDAKEKRL
jgi:tetratricopeptide (TPR) repeat protein